MISLPSKIEKQNQMRENAVGNCPCRKLRQSSFNVNPNMFSAQKRSGMLWKAMRVGAALKAVSMVAGASVLKPYL